MGLLPSEAWFAEKFATLPAAPRGTAGFGGLAVGLMTASPVTNPTAATLAAVARAIVGAGGVIGATLPSCSTTGVDIVRLSVSDAAPVLEGNDAVFTLSATAATGYSLSDWGGACDSSSAPGACTLNWSTANNTDQTIVASATFSANQYTLTFTAGANGYVTMVGDITDRWNREMKRREAMPAAEPPDDAPHD